MLKQVVEEKWLSARAVIGFFPANSIDDDIELYTDDERTEVKAVLHHLRQSGSSCLVISNSENFGLDHYLFPIG